MAYPRASSPDAKRPLALALAALAAWLIFSPLALLLAIAAMGSVRRVHRDDPLAPRLAQARIAATCALALALVSLTAETIALVAGAPLAFALLL